MKLVLPDKEDMNTHATVSMLHPESRNKNVLQHKITSKTHL